MIKLLRVDHRLLHGQVAFSWKNAVESGVDVTIQMVPEDSPVNVEKVL